MNLLMICCVVSFIAGVTVTRNFYKKRMGNYDRDMGEALRFCNEYHALGEEMLMNRSVARSRRGW